ncbi:hypothetical protein EON81_09085 [bacterium]|nr:MAG: hypothetical protein EON81_09085 [bacterium]
MAVRSTSLAFLLASAALFPALAPAQRLVAWGDNGVGQCNINASALYGSRMSKAGYYFTMAQKADGTLVGWGDNSYGELNVPAAAQTGVVGFVGGVLHTLAFKSDGSVVAWGSNERGETNVPLAASSGVTGVAGGEYFSLALKDGGVIGWGSNDYGVLSVPSTAQSGVTKIASGSYHALAIKNGEVIAWGMNVAGSLNVPAAAQSGVVAVAAGYDYSWALKEDGTLIGWGDNDYGWINVPAGAQEGVVDVSAVAYHTVAQVAAAYCKLDQAQVQSGDSATGTVKLAQAAPSGGTVVGLVSDNSAVEVPSSVTVPEGATSATFPVFTNPFLGPVRSAKIRTSYNGTKTVSATLKVTGTTVAATFNVPSTVGGSTSRPMLTVGISAPYSSDVLLTLQYDAALSGPGTVTIPAGSMSASVPVTTNPLYTGSSQGANVLYEGLVVGTGTIEVTPFRASVTFEASSVQSGETTLGTIYLNATARNAVTVNLSSDNPAVPVPGTLTVKATGRAVTFSIPTRAVATTQYAKVTATINGNSYIGNLKLVATPGVRSLTLAPTIYGNGKAIGTVRLTQAAKAGGTTVQLSSSDSSLSVPASVTVLEGAYTATFPATASDVSSETLATVTAANALGSASTGVAVKPLTLASFTLTPTTVAAGASVEAKVSLNAVVAVDTVIELSSNDPALVSLPATVTILAGSRIANFTVTAGSPTKAKLVRITATKNASVLVRTIKINP